MRPETIAILQKAGQRLAVYVLALWPGMAFATCSLGTGWELLQYESFSPIYNPPVIAAIGIGDKAVTRTGWQRRDGDYGEPRPNRNRFRCPFGL